jgi:hypothetical protein
MRLMNSVCICYQRDFRELHRRNRTFSCDQSISEAVCILLGETVYILLSETVFSLVSDKQPINTSGSGDQYVPRAIESKIKFSTHL